MDKLVFHFLHHMVCESGNDCQSRYFDEQVAMTVMCNDVGVWMAGRLLSLCSRTRVLATCSLSGVRSG